MQANTQQDRCFRYLKIAYTPLTSPVASRFHRTNTTSTRSHESVLTIYEVRDQYRVCAVNVARRPLGAMTDNEIDLTETNGGKLICTASVLLSLTWISVILRGYTRAILTKSFRLDDWLMVLSQVSPPLFSCMCEKFVPVSDMVVGILGHLHHIQRIPFCRRSRRYWSSSRCHRG